MLTECLQWVLYGVDWLRRMQRVASDENPKALENEEPYTDKPGPTGKSSSRGAGTPLVPRRTQRQLYDSPPSSSSSITSATEMSPIRMNASLFLMSNTSRTSTGMTTTPSSEIFTTPALSDLAAIISAYVTGW